ncbi:MAG: AMP-binding protein, partial [Treponema sp.]|nr:AMP-binding protein [Treponema sp.]
MGAFGSTLIAPPSMAFRFALLADRLQKDPFKRIRGSPGAQRVEAYCYKVTAIWCVFFILNGSAALYTIVWASESAWALYNGGISYVFMGTLFAVEWIVRKMMIRRMPKAAPLSRLSADLRPQDAVVCFSGSYGGGTVRTWADFLAGSAALRRHISAETAERWILHCNDYWYFLLAFTALLQCGKQVFLTANIAPRYIAEIAGGQEDTAFLTDDAGAAGRSGTAALLEKSFYAPALAESGDTAAETALPPINADETVIVMYTSGTTGRPKAVYQRLTEFEADNAFILSKWGEEVFSRAVCSSVSPHHIYGLLFSVLLPFTAGVPFRRERIEFPETLETLRDSPYLFVTVPAFLKRCVESVNEAETARGFGLRSPWIFTSGGAVPFEVAKKTEALLGFWPLEVYGSTETSGIAWRQSVSGPEWTPFDNAKIRLNGEGCLVIQSPYIKDPGGFTTGDLAEILDDGRFLLKGRADSIVKIEEKRVSLPEVEARLVQSDLVSDAAVTAIQGKRQYLAAALVLNAAGAARFAGTEKRRVNQWFREYLGQFFEPTVIPKRWRYPDALPRNPQGKIRQEAIRALFADEPEQ